MKILLTALVPCLFIFPPAAAAGDEILYLAASETEALLAKEGQKVVVHGDTSGSKKSASGTNFVNFKDAVFFLVTFKSDLGQFPDGEPSDAFEGKRIAVEGAIAIYQGKPQIKLTDPKQVTILAPDADFPPTAMKDAPVEAAKPTEENPVTVTPPAPEAPKRKPPVDPSEYFKKKE